MKRKYYFLLALLSIITFTSSGQEYMIELFETGDTPDQWDDIEEIGGQEWRYRNGGHSPNDIAWEIPAWEEDIRRNPDGAYEGTYNAIFFVQSPNNERTKLVTDTLDLLGGSNIELSFYLCQIPWDWGGYVGWDILSVYYKNSLDGDWVLLHTYPDWVLEWEKQVLTLPNPTETYFLAFEGETQWGFGTCIDSVMIKETGSQPMYISEIEIIQPFETFLPSGAKNVPLIRLDIKVVGNTDSVKIDDITFTSLNTSDSDIVPNSLKLYSTASQTFSKSNPIGNPTSYNSGEATFTGLNHYLPRGLSYIWLAGDIEVGALHENIVDVMVKAGDILADGSTFPTADNSPSGERVIYESRYMQDFEGAHGWSLSGEFQVAIPAGQGENPGNSNPTYAASGTYVLGTDLTGLGTTPYKYEPNLTDETSYIAMSPVIDALYYKNLNLFYDRYLNIEAFDHATIEVSDDNGANWNMVWENTSTLNDFKWVKDHVAIPETFSRTNQFKMRFKLGPTDAINNYSGWSIDNMFLTGEFVSKDVGVSEWIYPQSGSGHTSSDSVTLEITNYGGAEITDPVPVAFSLDNGVSWTINHMNTDIPVGGSVNFTFASTGDFSQPGLNTGIRAKTFLPGDQFIANDQISTEIFIVPSHTLPYTEYFDLNNGYWRVSGTNLWQHGKPTGSIINTAASGTKTWVTGTTETYGAVISEEEEFVFYDDFESDMGWTFSGEFEREIPSNIHNPYGALSGYYCIGTDLSGTGAHPYLYENGINSDTELSAVSPVIDVSNYSNLTVSFARILEIAEGDSVKLEVSPNGGADWYLVWKNSDGAYTEWFYDYVTYPVPEELNSASELTFRFSLFYTSTSDTVAAGLSLDDFIVMGDFVNLTPGYLSTASYDLTSIFNPLVESRIWIETEPGRDGAALFYSLDDGNTWSPIVNNNSLDAYWNWYTGNHVSSLGQDGWSGSTGGWITTRHVLPSTVRNQENVQFRFKFTADKLNNNYDGIAIDNFAVYEAPDDMGIDEILSPTSTCELGSNEKFIIRVTNDGIKTLKAGTKYDIGYRIEMDGVIQTAQETVTLPSNISPGGNLSLNLGKGFDMSESGLYTVEIFTKESFHKFYSATSTDTAIAYIEVQKPHVDLGPDISTSEPDTVFLDASTGNPSDTYWWNGILSGPVFDVTTEGTYDVKVMNTLNCYAYDTISVLQLVVDASVSQLRSPASACELGNQLPVEITVKNSGTDVIGITDTIYVFAEINGVIEFTNMIVPSAPLQPDQTIDFSFAGTHDFSSPGAYSMKIYTVMSRDQVISNDTLFITVENYGYPDIDLGKDTVVYAASYLLSPGAGYNAYLWQDGSTAEDFLVEQEGAAEYHVRVSDAHNCTSYDTVNVTLNVADLALAAILSPETSCEPATSITVSVQVRNEGNQPILSGEEITIKYMVNGGALKQQTFALLQDLPADGTVDLTFTNSESVTTGQWYDFLVYLQYVNDTKPGNDTLEKTVGIFDPPDIDFGPSYQVISDVKHTLDAGPGFVSYLWQNGSTGQTFTVTKPGLGTYWVRATDENGCEVFEQVIIMLAIPDVGILDVLQPVTACTLSNAEHLKARIKNYGNYHIAPSALLYAAYSVNGSEAVTERVILADTLNPGDTITYTFSKAENLSAAGHYEFVVYTIFAADLVPSNDIKFKGIDVLGAPVVNISNGKETLFIDDQYTMNVNTGYQSYLWQDGSTGTSYTITEPGADLYWVSVTGNNGCITSDSIFIVWDIPDLAIVNIISPVNSCEQASPKPISVEIKNEGYFRLTSTDTLRLIYRVDTQNSVAQRFAAVPDLEPGETRTLTFTNGYTFSTSGDYALNVKLDYNKDMDFSDNEVDRTVKIFEAPVPQLEGGTDTVRTELPYTLNAGSGYSSYLWPDNSTGTSYQAKQYGIHWVEVTNAEGCPGRDSVYITFPVSVYGNILESEHITVYPNPADTEINIELDMETDREIILELYNIVNKLLYKEELMHSDFTKVQIDIQDLEPGTYMLRIRADMMPYTYHIVVE